jgi:Domain of unknown function (DUF4189)
MRRGDLSSHRNRGCILGFFVETEEERSYEGVDRNGSRSTSSDVGSSLADCGDNQRAACSSAGWRDMRHHLWSGWKHDQSWALRNPAGGLLWAMAISPSTLSTAGSHGQRSQSDAEQQALQSCRSTGSKDCVVAYWARNECVALATTARTPGTYGAAYAPGRSGAAAAALAQCISHGGQGCFVRATPCAGDDERWPSPLPLLPGNQPGSVDPNWVGTW